MDQVSDSTEFELPLELQFSMAKAEIQAKELTWDQLYFALMNLYHRRLMENHALQTLLAEEHIKVEFDVPTELELVQLGVFNFDDLDDDEYEGAA